MRFETAWRKLERRVGEVSDEEQAAIALGFVRQWCDSFTLGRIVGISVADVGVHAVNALGEWASLIQGRLVYPEIAEAFERRAARKKKEAEPRRPEIGETI